MTNNSMELDFFLFFIFFSTGFLSKMLYFIVTEEGHSMLFLQLNESFEIVIVCKKNYIEKRCYHH